MKRLIFFIILACPFRLYSQQVADSTYRPEILHPVYRQGKGPVVFIDEGHYNFHTMSGRYQAFAALLERDGYNVKPYTGMFKKKELSGGRILVLSNALNAVNEEGWYKPTPSAFTEDEISTVRRWVDNGGSLFLIADHIPFAGAAADLAAAFGFGMTNGFVLDTASRGADFFDLGDGTLVKSAITEGRDTSESVHRIATFTGQGFSIPDDATPVLLFSSRYVNLMPDTAWIFDESTVRNNAGGLAQGACKRSGRGRVAVFGEAAMFSAQLAGPQAVRVGMNSGAAPENYQLLLNIIHWLDGKIE